jgi:hypothetical protein
MKAKVRRQGDILFLLVAELPEDVRPATVEIDPVLGGVILARGEQEGHSHVLLAAAERVYEPAAENEHDPALELRFIEVLEQGGVEVRHPEHATITLGPGIWETRRQRELDWHFEPDWHLHPWRYRQISD